MPCRAMAHLEQVSFEWCGRIDAEFLRGSSRCSCRSSHGWSGRKYGIWMGDGGWTGKVDVNRFGLGWSFFCRWFYDRLSKDFLNFLKFFFWGRFFRFLFFIVFFVSFWGFGMRVIGFERVRRCSWFCCLWSCRFGSAYSLVNDSGCRRSGSRDFFWVRIVSKGAESVRGRGGDRWSLVDTSDRLW